MKKSSSGYICKNCNVYYSKWAGQCSECKSWSSIEKVESLTEGPNQSNLGMSKGKTIELFTLASEIKDPLRAKIGINEFDRVLGGGLVASSAILVGGDPGIGKSTLLLQVAADYSNTGASVIYVSGEEATSQIRMRARRLNKAQSTVKLASETNLRNILTTLDSERVDLVIIDSIQTIWADNIESAPGSVAQVRACVLNLTNFAKKRGISVILVGHVTKEGQIAGPRVVEHMVDTVLYFEGERGIDFRILRAVKNRFGPADEIGVFEMTACGLKQVPNPSQLFLSERNDNSSGSVVFATIEGTRPVLVEIQALVSTTSLGTARRTVIGWDNARLSMILAILESRCKQNFLTKDVYLNVAGGMKINEPGADLAVAAALLSAAEEIEIPNNSIIFGELSLSGKLRHVAHPDSRIKEAKKLGFSSIMVPEKIKIAQHDDIKIDKYVDINEFIERNQITS